MCAAFLPVCCRRNFGDFWIVLPGGTACEPPITRRPTVRLKLTVPLWPTVPLQGCSCLWKWSVLDCFSAIPSSCADAVNQPLVYLHPYWAASTTRGTWSLSTSGHTRRICWDASDDAYPVWCLFRYLCRFFFFVIPVGAPLSSTHSSNFQVRVTCL